MNDFVGGFDPYAKAIELVANKLNDVIEQLDTLSARVDQLHDDLGFFSHSVNNVEILIKRISHDVYEGAEKHPPARFRDISNGE